jgi:sugar lactone lactonase YvrE
VLGWRSVDALTNGAPADLVIGQQDFLTSLAQCNNAAVTGETLCNPSAVAVDAAGNLYVVDSLNNRGLEYNSPFSTDTVPDLVFGQNGSFTSSTCNLGGSITDATLCRPGAVAVDQGGHVYISDSDNSRILEYNAPSLANTRADTVFGQGGNFNSSVCNNGGVSANSLCSPSFLALDAAGNLYAEDAGTRVLEYNSPLTTDTTADMVFGQGNSLTSETNNCAATPSAGNFCAAAGVAVDGSGNLYVGDGFARVLEFDDPISTGHTSADAVFGQLDFSSSGCNNGGVGPQGLCAPGGLAIDNANNLYVADAQNNRVLEFNSPLAVNPPNNTADLVLGQPDFSHLMPNIAKPNSLFLPMGVAVDTSLAPNRLYVSDFQNHRVLGWHSVPAFTDGAPADLVIGQPDFFSGNCNQTSMGSTFTPSANTCAPPMGSRSTLKATSMLRIAAIPECWNMINPSAPARSPTCQRISCSASREASPLEYRITGIVSRQPVNSKRRGYGCRRQPLRRRYAEQSGT